MFYSKTEEHLTVSGFFYSKMTSEVKKRNFRAGEPLWNSFYQRDRQILVYSITYVLVHMQRQQK